MNNRSLILFLAATVALVPARAGAQEGHEHAGHSHEPGEKTRAAADKGANAIAYYTCSMHNSVRATQPGKCPICSMDLTPVYQKELDTGVIPMSAERRKLVGIRLQEVTRGPLRLNFRSPGVVAYDENGLRDISLRSGAWVEKLYASATGAAVKRGEPLFEIYSPDLYSVQHEYLLALGQAKSASLSGARAGMLAAAATRNLELWGMDQEQITELALSGNAVGRAKVLSPLDGFILEKNAVEGGFLMMGERALRLAPLDRVFVEAAIYESELPYARADLPVEVRWKGPEGEMTAAGKVAAVLPAVREETRTATLRIVLDNPGTRLRPGQTTEVVWKVELGDKLLVPAAAVIFSGTSRLVFVEADAGHLQIRRIRTGARAGESYEVLEGLEEGAEVVASGTFLVAAESRLRSAAAVWGGEE